MLYNCSVKAYKTNPRSITDRALKRLRDSLAELGDLGGVVYNENSGQICGGHQRLRSMFGEQAGTFNVQDADIEIATEYEEPTKQGTIAEGFIRWKNGRYSFRKVRWDEATFRRANFVANQPAGEWDWDLFANTINLADLTAWGVDPSAWLMQLNVDAGAVRAMIEAEKVVGDAEPQFDRAAELLEKWKVERGFLYQVGGHKLLCGDSTCREDVDKLMQGEKAGAVVTDPPYGINIVGRNGTAGNFPGTNAPRLHAPPIVNDDKPFDPAHLMSLASKLILWGGNYYADKLPAGGKWLVWDKKDGAFQGSDLGDCELAWTNLEGASRLLHHTWQGMYRKGKGEGLARLHPTQKPIDLMVWCIEQCGGVDVILDCYAGSGTTLVACQNLGRKCRAIEISEKYCSVILQRMQDAFPGLPIERIV